VCLFVVSPVIVITNPEKNRSIIGILYILAIINRTFSKISQEKEIPAKTETSTDHFVKITKAT
ncbi:hypothetical protein J5690_10170, partial [bacterium]|nr:hypothetical protein [bacterium]